MPVAETARGRGKSGRGRSASRAKAVAAASAALGLLAMSWAHAGPTGGQIVAGKGSISQSGSLTALRHSTQSLSIDWLSFDVAPHETVDFIQPSASAIAVNRIGGNTGSEILGHLESNGQVYLINPNGVLFGAGAQVNVGGLVASTLDVSDASLSSSRRSFTGNGSGSVVNEGTITAASGGGVALLGTQVSNSGVIRAQLGTVALGAGHAVTLTFAGDSLVHLNVDRGVLKSLADNHGVIEADGGQVLMTAGAKDALLASVVNNSGIIEARTVENHAGTITLLGGMTAGTVTLSGTLDASAASGGDGGHIETSAAHVEVADSARVTTAAARGLTGSWLIDPQDYTVAPSGGDITGATLSTELGTTSITLQSSQGGTTGSGNINVNDAVSWSANNALTLTASNSINVNGSITASGANASLVLNANTANGSESASGSGTLNLGPGASVTLSGANAALSINSTAPQNALPDNFGVGAAINLPNVSPTSTAAFVLNRTPYIVINQLGAPGSATGTDLQGIGAVLSGHFVLGGNLDATSTSTWNSGTGFNPIGNSTAAFTGIFDGLGHTIQGLFVNRPTNDVGLFGVAASAAGIYNLGLVGGSITGGNYVGGLAGTNFGHVVNSYTTGPVSGTSTLYSAAAGVGGLVGNNYGAIVLSHATGTVGGFQNIGGLVGVNANSILESFATGNDRAHRCCRALGPQRRQWHAAIRLPPRTRLGRLAERQRQRMRDASQSRFSPRPGQ
jgi:filamentous hemagglutinin family protein